jgi:hypothetical protein
MDHCCTTPLPGSGVGNFDDAPGFVNAASDFHLLPNSPAINAGINSAAVGMTDLDGNPRIQGGSIDLGAFEFQSPASAISYEWLYQYGLPVDGSADYTDPDGDGMNNWQEWRCGTNPTNAVSTLRMLPLVFNQTNLNVSWFSQQGVTYFLERSTNLSTPLKFMRVATNLLGQTDTTSFIDTNAKSHPTLFYRVGVGP